MPLHLKLLKGLSTKYINSYTQHEISRFFLKVLYEFWGFCVNGTDSLTIPGGFVSTNYNNLPVGFESGSTTLLASGSDGITTFMSNEFTSESTDFRQLNLNVISTESTMNHGLMTKYCVLWKPDSDSKDDSIYRISGLGSTPNSILLEQYVGNGPRKGGKNSFRDRTNINFRIIDINATTKLAGFASNQGMVIQLNGAPEVNIGQDIPQARIAVTYANTTNDYNNKEIKFTLQVSPGGTWNGSAFTDGSPISSNTFLFVYQYNSTFYMFGARDFLIFSIFNTFTNIPRVSGMHLEVPKRLYPIASDKNPVAWCTWVNNSTYDNRLSFSQTSAYWSGFSMFCEDNQVRNWNCITRVPLPIGTKHSTSITTTNQSLYSSQTIPNYFGTANYNVDTTSYLTSPILLHHTGSATDNQHSMTRCRLRRVRSTFDNIPVGTRFNDDWTYVGNGLLFPWDGSSQQIGLFWNGTP